MLRAEPLRSPFFSPSSRGKTNLPPIVLELSAKQIGCPVCYGLNSCSYSRPPRSFRKDSNGELLRLSAHRLTLTPSHDDPATLRVPSGSRSEVHLLAAQCFELPLVASNRFIKSGGTYHSAVSSEHAASAPEIPTARRVTDCLNQKKSNLPEHDIADATDTPVNHFIDPWIIVPSSDHRLV